MAIKIFIGKGTEESNFSIDLGEDRINEISLFLKKLDWKNTIHKQYKNFYFGDIKYSIDSESNHYCTKEKITSFKKTPNAIYAEYEIYDLEPSNFPGITGYHDTRLVESTLFCDDNIKIELSNINENNGSIYYQCVISLRTQKKLTAQQRKRLDDITTFFNIEPLNSKFTGIPVSNGKYHNLVIL